MKKVWCWETMSFIESWMFEEWYLNQANRPTLETLEIIKQFQCPT